MTNWTEELIDSHFTEMRILLTETCEHFTKTDWFEKYRHFDTVESFEMMEDDVQRLKKAILLHDALCSIPTDELFELLKLHDIPYER